MKNNNLFFLLSAVSCMALAQSQPTAPAASSPTTSSAAMQPKTENGITYLCGGVGLDESAAMKQAARSYDLMSTFAAQDGSYLADVNVDILDKSGATILHTTCGGPMMLVKLPHAGNYRLRAQVDGNAQTKIAKVSSGRNAGPQRLVFVWPAAQAGLEQSRLKQTQ
jgi:hypothetical protein